MITSNPRRTLTYYYQIDETVVRIMRRHLREAYARNGNTHNPTQYYLWETYINMEYQGWSNTRREAYEYAYKQITGKKETRPFWVVQAEMRGALIPFPQTSA